MDGVGAFQRQVEGLAGLVDVDVDALGGDQTLEWATSLVRSRNLLDALLAPVAGRLETLSSGPARYARWKGYPSASALLAGSTGLAQADATRLIDLGRTLCREIEAPRVEEEVSHAGALGFDDLEQETSESTPDALREEPPAAGSNPPSEPVEPARRVLSPLAQAAKDGVLGEPKIRVIAQTLADMSVETAELELELVRRAHRLRLRELRILCLQKFSELDPEAYADRQLLQRRQRELRFFPRPDGMVGVSGTLDVETAGHVLACFDAETKAAMHGQRGWDESEQRTIGQINADILASLARHANGCGRATTRPKTTMVVRVSEESLRTRIGVGTCDSLEGPIGLQTLRRMAIDAEVLPVVMGGDSLPLDVGRARRYATPAQRTAAGERDQGCAMCHAPLTWCEGHHIDWWSLGGKTSAENTVMLCGGCHHRVHDCGWIVEIDSKHEVTFIPPAKVDSRRRRQLSSSARLAA